MPWRQELTVLLSCKTYEPQCPAWQEITKDGVEAIVFGLQTTVVSFDLRPAQNREFMPSIENLANFPKQYKL